MTDARMLALDVLIRCEREQTPADPVMVPMLANSRLKEVDRRLVKMLVQTTHRWRARADRVLDRRLDKGIQSLEPEILAVLRMAYIQLFHLDSIPPHAAVNTAVEMARYYGSEGVSRLVNRILRGLLTTPPSEADWKRGSKLEALRGEYSHPSWLLERWLNRYDEDTVRRLCDWNNSPPQMHIRAVGGDEVRSRVLDYLEDEQIQYQSGEVVPEALRIQGRFSVAGNPLLHEGLITIQDESQMLVGRLWPDDCSGPVFDMCAAPGTKTAHICDRNPEALVVAADVTARRLKRVEHTRRRLELKRLVSVVADGRRPPFGPVFERVLVDAPCSGLGVLKRRPDARWLRTPMELMKAAVGQGELLNSAASLVKPGGLLLYSLCSLEPEEADDQVGLFLERHGEFKIEPLPDWVPEALRAESGCLTVLPGTLGMEGMFAALMRRGGA
jgi:16S rRNA (cytosine967-C5)-methyltransferase